MTPWEAIALVAIAVFGAGGPLVVWISMRGTRAEAVRAAEIVGDVAESVGPRNGYGSIQDQSAQMIDRLGSIENTLELMSDVAANISARLKGHDREISTIRASVRHVEDRIVALEARPCKGEQ